MVKPMVLSGLKPMVLSGLSPIFVILRAVFEGDKVESS